MAVISTNYIEKHAPLTFQDIEGMFSILLLVFSLLIIFKMDDKPAPATEASASSFRLMFVLSQFFSGLFGGAVIATIFMNSEMREWALAIALPTRLKSIILFFTATPAAFFCLYLYRNAIRLIQGRALCSFIDTVAIKRSYDFISQYFNSK